MLVLPSFSKCTSVVGQNDRTTIVFKNYYHYITSQSLIACLQSDIIIFSKIKSATFMHLVVCYNLNRYPHAKVSRDQGVILLKIINKFHVNSYDYSMVL